MDLSQEIQVHNNSNDNNNGYVYMAFAENPIVANVGSSIPATAR